MRIPIAGAGMPYVLSGLAVSVLFWLISLHIAAGVFLVLSLLVAGFFRDPNRAVNTENGALLSPADGKVIDIKEIKGAAPEGPPHSMVCIFMSLFDCHINRSPSSGTVQNVKHTPGKFLAAFKEAASEVNERNAVTLVDTRGEQVSFTQVAGVIARRIVCEVKRGDVLEAGQRIGMIKFGSRVDVEIPSAFQVVVGVGDKVRAGKDVLGRRLSCD